jgi:hypothetical protein
VAYYSFLPCVITETEEERRTTCSKLFNHFHARLVLNHALRPIRVPVQARVPSGRSNGQAWGADGRLDLLGLFSEQRQQAVHEAVTDALLGLASYRERTGQSVDWEEASEAILDVLREERCGPVVGHENLPSLRDQIALLWRRRRTPDADLANLIGADWDKVWAADFLEPLRLFTAGACGVETFEELRQVLGISGRVAAEEWARAFVRRYEPGRLPSQRSYDPQERADAKLSELRMAKKGTGRGLHYPTVEAILEGGGHAGILRPTDHRAEAEAWARDAAARYLPGRLPSMGSSDPLERADAKKVARLRSAKAGKAGRAAFYPSVEAIFEAAGHRGVFEPTDHRSKAEVWAIECAARYKPGQLPRDGTSDARERSDLAKIRNLRNAKRGTGGGMWYPSVEVIFEEAGHRGVFEVGLRPGRS